jgi:hypothetical protein
LESLTYFVKKALLFISLFSILSGFAFTEVLTYLKGRVETDAILIEWQSGNEVGVLNYTVERSEIKSNDFEELATIAVTGNNSSYRYRDASVNEIAPNSTSSGGRNKAPLAELYKYRIKINYTDAVSYSQSITVTRPSSGVKRTWGMIKEMFR